MQDYSVFGLRVRSDMPLPELHAAEGPAEPDVVIRQGAIGEPNRDAGLHAVDGAMLFVAPDAARYRIAAGSEILVEPNADVPDRNVRLYLLGSAFGALLHQRGLLPLHANAVEIDGRAFAFMGQQGEGKSTLAAWFHDQGDRIIADDVCVIRIDRGSAWAVPGLPRLRLWEDAIVRSGRRSDRLARSYAGDEEWNKFDVPVAPDRSVRDEIPVGAIYLAESGDAFDVTPLQGVEAAQALFEHTYRGGYLEAANGHESHWQAIVELVRRVPVFRLVRKRGFSVFDQQATAVRDHAARLPAAW